MQVIKSSGHKIALKFGQADIKDGLSFFSEPNDYIQVGGWRYTKGKKLSSHIHNLCRREIGGTQEFIYVVKGRLKASIYDDKENLIESLVLEAGEGLVLFCGGHGYQILQDDTVVIETKNGPYPGADIDRRRFSDER